MSTILQFSYVFFTQIWECTIPKKWIIPTQWIGKHVIRTKPTGEDNPASRSCLIQAQEAPGLHQGPHPRPEDSFWPVVHGQSKLLPLLHREAEPPGEDCSQFEQQHLDGLGQDHRFPVFSIETDQKAAELCQHRGLLHCCFIFDPMIPYEGSPTF